MNRFQQIVGAIPEASGKIADALLLMIGGILVIRGRLTLGMLLAFNSLFDSFCEPVNSLVGFIQKIQTLNANLRRIEDVEKYQEDARYEEKKDQTTGIQKKLTGDIELRDVSFGYSSLKPPLIEHFSFLLHSGESIAFGGASPWSQS